eukprot:1155033-Pelagomonas_calceolata.AAC.11
MAAVNKLQKDAQQTVKTRNGCGPFAAFFYGLCSSHAQAGHAQQMQAFLAGWPPVGTCMHCCLRAITIHVSPPGFHKLQAGLLLTLMGGVRKNEGIPGRVAIRGDIHVLLVGDPGLGKSQLLQSVSCGEPLSSLQTTGRSLDRGLSEHTPKYAPVLHSKCAHSLQLHLIGTILALNTHRLQGQFEHSSSTLLSYFLAQPTQAAWHFHPNMLS